MVSRHNPSAGVQARREELAEQRDEPVDTVERIAKEHGDSLYANLPPISRKLLDIEAGDDIEVETHDDRVVVRPATEE